MPLLIFLKQPNRAIAVKDKENLFDIKKINFDNVFAMRFDKLDGGSVLIIKDNISHIEEISEKEIKRQKAEYERRLKQQRQRNGQLVTPNLVIPRGSRN